MKQANARKQNFNEYSVLPLDGGFYSHYLNKNCEVQDYALERYRKVFALRFDLRVPTEYCYQDTNLVTRFISSLKAQLHADNQRKKRQGSSYVHSTDLMYVWAREEGHYGKPHYHFCIFLNGDAYRSLGKIQLERDNLYNRIVKAWARALNTNHTLDSEWCFNPQLVSIPPNCEYFLDRRKPDFDYQYHSLYTRLSYLAKTDSKPRGSGVNCYGTSRIPRMDRCRE